jgi:dienelactone hydrolase
MDCRVKPGNDESAFPVASVLGELPMSRYETPWTFSHDGISHPVYSAGKGPTVIVIHELPGMVAECLDLGLILAERFRVHLPLLFGEPGRFSMLGNLARICVAREIYLFSAHQTSPLVGWLRALCRDLHGKSGGPGIGVIGMCLTGGFALALVAEESVLAPVVAQPSLPLMVHKASLGLSETDTAAVRDRAAKLGPNCVLGLRYAADKIAPREKIDAIRQLIGPAFDYEELPGDQHATLTVHRHPRALERTIAFLSERLGVADPR